MNGFGDWLGSWWPSASASSVPADVGAGLDVAYGGTGAAAAAPSDWWGSFKDVASSVWSPVRQGLGTLGSVAKEVLPVAQLGAGVMGGISSAKAAGQLAEQAKLAKTSQQTQQEATRQAMTAAAPMTEFGQQQLSLAQQGALPAPIEEQIKLWQAGAIQKARDYLARAGMGDSKALLDWESWIGQQAVAMRAQALQDMERLGVSSLQAGAGALAGAGGAAAQGAQLAQGQMAGLESLISQANAQIAQLAGSAA